MFKLLKTYVLRFKYVENKPIMDILPLSYHHYQMLVAMSFLQKMDFTDLIVLNE